jgi:hypothetical protein
MHPAENDEKPENTVPRSRPEVLAENNMRARPEIAVHLIATRMKHWLDIVQCPIINIRVPTWKARKNYRALVRRYPQIAAALGYTEAMSYASPLQGLWSPVQQEERQQSPPAHSAPQQEFPIGSPNSDATNPAPAPRFVEQIRGSHPESPACAVPRMISLEDEVV